MNQETGAPTTASNHPSLWFLNSLVQIHVASKDGTDGISAMEHWVPAGDSPPLHSHLTQDELFHIIKGEFLFQLGDTRQRVGPGTMVLAPRGSIHSYLVESKEGGRFVTITRGDDFERFVRALGRPATRRELPPPSGPPSPEALATLTQVAAAHGIVIHGPPLH